MIGHTCANCVNHDHQYNLNLCDFFNRESQKNQGIGCDAYEEETIEQNCGSCAHFSSFCGRCENYSIGVRENEGVGCCSYILRQIEEHVEQKAKDITKIPEAISREALRERDRCVSLIWENRGKCISNASALALMAIINGEEV